MHNLQGDATTVPSTLTRTALLGVGEIVANTYEVHAFLGAGGMSQVFEAHDQELNRRVAVKVAPPGITADLLRNEGRTLAALRHPSVVTVHTSGQHGELAYLVLERIQGVSLQEHFDRRAAAGQPFSIGEALDLLQMLAEGLSVIHRAGISHRDVKPGNIMLAPGHRLVLMDFGLGRPERGGGPETFGGTPTYMAPEVILQSVQEGEGHLVDLYALGIIAYRLLAGHMPFGGPSSVETLCQHLQSPVPDLRDARPEVPEPLAALVTELLQKEPSARPPSAAAVLWQLYAIAAKRDARKDQLSVLIVDDDRVATELLRHVVTAAVPEARIEAARDAEGALAVFRKRPPDLMLLDLNLPGMSGVELSMYLHGTGEGQRCTIVAVSGTASASDVQLLDQLGVTHHVAKGPELAAQLTALLRELARRMRGEDG